MSIRKDYGKGLWEGIMGRDYGKANAFRALHPPPEGRGFSRFLVSWPVADESIMAVLEFWSSEKPIFYIGEMPTSELPGLAGLPGCACDEFFERTEVVHTFESYPSSNMLEKAVILKIKEENQ